MEIGGIHRRRAGSARANLAKRIAIGLALLPAPAAAVPGHGLGALEGFVRLVGPEVPQPTRVENTTDPAVCGRMQTLDDLLVSVAGRGIQNVIVALEDTWALEIPTPLPVRLVLDNRDCRFVPHVGVLTVGSTIEATNSDPLLHNVHLYGAFKANIALPFQGLAVERTVAEPGMIIVKCDVHGWMQAFIRVDSHPFHAVTDQDGHFRIPGIPAGTHNLETWHEKLGRQRKTIHIEAGKTERIEVEYSLGDGGPYSDGRRPDDEEDSPLPRAGGRVRAGVERR